MNYGDAMFHCLHEKVIPEKVIPSRYPTGSGKEQKGIEERERENILYAPDFTPGFSFIFFHHLKPGRDL